MVVPPSRPFGKRLILLCDVSGSMAKVFGDMVSTAEMLASSSVDDYEIAVYAFGSTFCRLPSSGFMKMPDAGNTNLIVDWLRSQPPGSHTFVVPPLFAAIPEGDVILITDGDFSEGILNVHAALLQRGITNVTIVAIGKVRLECFSQIGKLGGGYFHVATPGDQDD